MKTLIDIVDMQHGFMVPGGNLAITGADSIIAATNAFLARLDSSHADAVLVKYDTHFAGEYPQSPESQMFPMHCEFNTPDWQYCVDVGQLDGKVPVQFMLKNTFDMWGQQPKMAGVVFANELEEANYATLYQVKNAPTASSGGVDRDAWMDANNIGAGTNVVLFGVASDYCVRDAIMGYLKRGCNVTVVRDLTFGIGQNPDRSIDGSPDIFMVLMHPDFDAYRDQIALTSSADFFGDCSAAPACATKPPRCAP